MENIATSAIMATPNSNLFWEPIPAAAYVLLGVLISSVFTLISVFLNNKNNRNLKILETKNNIEIKELENKNNKEVQVLEITHKEKLQNLKEEGDKKLRLLDDKIKIFSEFHYKFSKILLSGSNKDRLFNIEELRNIVYQAQLLAPSIKNNLRILDQELKDYSNFYFDILNREKIYSRKEKDEKIDKFNKNIIPKAHIIFNSMADLL